MPHDVINYENVQYRYPERNKFTDTLLADYIRHCLLITRDPMREETSIFSAVQKYVGFTCEFQVDEEITDKGLCTKLQLTISHTFFIILPISSKCLSYKTLYYHF